MQVVLYNVEIRGRTILFTHFVDRGQAENKKGEMYSKIFFLSGRQFTANGCLLRGIQIPMSCKIRLVCWPSDCQSIPNS